MTTRARLALYLVVMHGLMGAVGVVVFVAFGPWLLAWEAVLLVSLAVGLVLHQRLWRPAELTTAAAELIDAGDFTCRFLPAGGGEVEALVQVYNRMIDRLREERLRGEEQGYFMRQVLDATPSGILLFDLDDRVALVNPGAATLLCTEASQLSGRSLNEVAATLPGLDTLGDGETTVLHLGRRRVRCRMSHFLDRGFPRRFVILEELTEELRRAAKAAHERIIRLLSHEVNNTVGATSSLLQSALTYGAQLPAEARADFDGALQVAISRIEQLNRFMSVFADVVRLPPPCLQPVDLRLMLGRIRTLVQVELRQRRIAWEWVEEKASEAALTKDVPMDAAQMEQVFLNVVKNAMEAIGTDGHIRARVGCEAGRPCVEVIDDGAGIGDDVSDHLFTPFFSTKENGQGIGLSFVQEVLSRHGFEFALEGAPGKGARFVVVF